MRRYYCDLEFETEDVVCVIELNGRCLRLAGKTYFETEGSLFRLVDLSETPKEALRAAIARRRLFVLRTKEGIERMKERARQDEMVADLAEHAEIEVRRSS